MRRSVVREGVGAVVGAEAAERRREKRGQLIRKTRRTRRRSLIKHRRRRKRDHHVNGSLKASATEAKVKIT